MMNAEEVEKKMGKILQNLRQNRFQLDQLLSTLQLQQQAALQGLQQLMEGQLVLQEGITGNLSHFEEKAGASQGLQGLFHGNPLLKQEIMQKRVALEQSVRKLREQALLLQQGLQQIGKSIQEVGRHISPEMAQEEKRVAEILEDLARQKETSPLLAP